MKAEECKDNRNFKVFCDAGNSDRHEVATDSLLLQIEQQIRRFGETAKTRCGYRSRSRAGSSQTVR